MRILVNTLIVLLFCGVSMAEGETSQMTYQLDKDIFYHPVGEDKADSYQKEKCLLDIYYPKNKKGFATVIWYHAGGITSGQKHIPDELKNKGVAVVAVGYRLYPKVKCPVYLQDAAAGSAWVFKNIEKLGGDPAKIFVSGHSAGGYLASMLCIDKRWLGEYGVNSDKFAGCIPLSGHAITHFTVRQERGIENTRPIIDQFAPLYHVRKDAPPILLITGQRDMEMLGRYEENAYYMRMLKVVGHKNVTIHEIKGQGHGMVKPALPIALKWIDEILNKK